MASNDADFENKAADIIGLYLNPPQHAAIFSVDEITFLLDYLDRDKDLFNSPGRIIDLNTIMALKLEKRKKSPQNSFTSSLALLQMITPITDEEIEHHILQRLYMASLAAERVSTLWALVDFYQGMQRWDIAIAVGAAILETTEDREERALCYRCLGGWMEVQREYDAALECYAKGLALRPRDTAIVYFLYNNSGYCLNLAGRYKEAEAMCRKAIEIDATRHNAWKNLGLSLEGQGEFVGASWSYIEATKLYPGDTRALLLLQRLIGDNPGLRSRFPGALLEEASCKEAAIESLSERPRMAHSTYEICRLKKVSENCFLLSKNGAEQSISKEAIEQLYTRDALLLLDYHPNVWVEIHAKDCGSKPQENMNTATTLEPQRIGGVSGWSTVVTDSNFAPCLILDGESLQKLKEH